eukprot:gene8381-9851_t
MSTQFIGSKIVLVTKKQIRYEGVLYTIDPIDNTIALKNVKSYGTEDRRDGAFIPPSTEVFDFIVFKSSDISDLNVYEAPAAGAAAATTTPAPPAAAPAAPATTAQQKPAPATTAPTMPPGQGPQPPMYDVYKQQGNPMFPPPGQLPGQPGSGGQHPMPQFMNPYGGQMGPQYGMPPGGFQGGYPPMYNPYYYGFQPPQYYGQQLPQPGQMGMPPPNQPFYKGMPTNPTSPPNSQAPPQSQQPQQQQAPSSQPPQQQQAPSQPQQPQIPPQSTPAQQQQQTVQPSVTSAPMSAAAVVAAANSGATFPAGLAPPPALTAPGKLNIAPQQSHPTPLTTSNTPNANSTTNPSTSTTTTTTNTQQNNHHHHNNNHHHHHHNNAYQKTGGFKKPHNFQKKELEEFNFEESNSRFSKEKLAEELDPQEDSDISDNEADVDTLANGVQSITLSTSYTPSNFFDSISCESLDKQNNEHKAKTTMFEQRKLDQETFGMTSVRTYDNRRGGRGQNRRFNSYNQRNNNQQQQNNSTQQPQATNNNNQKGTTN